VVVVVISDENERGYKNENKLLTKLVRKCLFFEPSVAVIQRCFITAYDKTVIL